MPNIEHRTLTGADLHEPKGCATAASGAVYTATGAGSGNWQSPTTGVNNANKITLNAQIPNLSAAGSVFVVSPIAGIITNVDIVMFGAIITAADTVSLKINGVAVTGSTVNIPVVSSGAGVVNSSTPSGANTVTAHGSIEVVNAGTSTNAIVATVTLTLNVT